MGGGGYPNIYTCPHVYDPSLAGLGQSAPYRRSQPLSAPPILWKPYGNRGLAPEEARAIAQAAVSTKRRKKMASKTAGTFLLQKRVQHRKGPAGRTPTRKQQPCSGTQQSLLSPPSPPPPLSWAGRNS